MTLPNQSITPIPNNEPDAIPSLWNTRYEEIDENFASLDQRQTSTENEIEAARAGGDSLADTINAIVTQIGGISGTLNGLASPTSVQNAVTLDWLYRNRRIAFELFAAGYNLQNHLGVSVTSGIMGDDSLDVADTSGVKVGEDYLLSDATDTTMVRVAAILTGTRLRLDGSLSRHWGAGAKLTGSTLAVRDDGGVDGVIGDQWVSRPINLGDDNTPRAVVIRRSLNAGEARLYFRDAYTTAWTERAWSVRRSGSGTSGVPEGFADYEYVVPMRGDGYLRMVIDEEPMVIRHVVALGGGTGQGGYVNPLMRPNAPTISSPNNNATNVIETPTLATSSYASPAGNPFSTSQFQISASSAFDSVLYDSGEQSSMTHSVPPGVLAANTVFYVRARVRDVSGMESDWSEITTFTTNLAYKYVSTPIVITPLNGQIDFPEQPTLQSSAFTTIGGADTHTTSQWQIKLASGNWSEPLHDSGALTTAKTAYTIPFGVLRPGQTEYIMRVRYFGASFGASQWSNEIKFTTKQEFSSVIGIVLTTEGGGAGSWKLVDNNYTPILASAAMFNSHPIYSAIVQQTIDGQAMIKIPKFYIKTGSLNNGPYAGRSFWMISDKPAAGYKVHPAFIKNGSEINQFWIGKHLASKGTKLVTVPTTKHIDVMCSLPGAIEIDRALPSEMKTLANNRNNSGTTGFAMWSIYQLSAIQVLALIELGSPGAGSISGNWRGIENLWSADGSKWQMVDGLFSDQYKKCNIISTSGNGQLIQTNKIFYSSGYPITMAKAAGAEYDLGTVFVAETTATSKQNGSYNSNFSAFESCAAKYGGGGLFALALTIPNPYDYNAHGYGPVIGVGSRLAKI